MRCGGSGQRQMLSWPPVPEEGYPGAVVCDHCSKGVQVRRGSVKDDKAQTGEAVLSGIVNRHQK